MNFNMHFCLLLVFSAFSHHGFSRLRAVWNWHHLVVPSCGWYLCFLGGLCVCVLVILKFRVEGKQYGTRPETPNTYKNTPAPRQTENMQRLKHIIDILADWNRGEIASHILQNWPWLIQCYWYHWNTFTFVFEIGDKLRVADLWASV